MGHAKERITIDVDGDTAEIIEDGLEALQPCIDDVIPESKAEENTDFSNDTYMDYLETFLI